MKCTFYFACFDRPIIIICLAVPVQEDASLFELASAVVASPKRHVTVVTECMAVVGCPSFRYHQSQLS